MVGSQGPESPFLTPKKGLKCYISEIQSQKHTETDEDYTSGFPQINGTFWNYLHQKGL